MEEPAGGGMRTPAGGEGGRVRGPAEGESVRPAGVRTRDGTGQREPRGAGRRLPLSPSRSRALARESNAAGAAQLFHAEPPCSTSGRAEEGEREPRRDHAFHEGQGGGRPRRPAPGNEVSSAPADEEMVLDELVRAAEVEVGTVHELERFGIISPRVVGGTPYYSRDAAIIAQLARAFARHGVEARHLRAYKGAAEREAGMVQQVIMPLIRQRNPEARRAAAEAVQELSHLGGELRAALLRSALTDLR
ncbi:MAG: hypothetical protein ACRDZX_04580 [Acidimicrobiales bacterium]